MRAVLAAVQSGANRLPLITTAAETTLMRRLSQRDIDRALQRLRAAGRIRYHKVNEGGTGWEPLSPAAGA
jgi:hypothetical protein